MKTPTYIEEIDWKGKKFILEFFDTTDFSSLSPKKQSAAICFTEDDEVVLFKHVDGYFSLPGGTIEEGEDEELALRREVLEESSCEVLDFGPIGYFKTYEKDKPETTHYQLRYWAKVRCLEETPDPDGKALHREIVSVDEAPAKLDWGERGEYLVRLAKEKMDSK